MEELLSRVDSKQANLRAVKKQLQTKFLNCLAVVQYSFDRHEHPIDIKPHGNSKGKKPFTRTKPSTLNLLKESVKTKPPRKALREVENVMGGVMGAKLACDLPRD